MNSTPVVSRTELAIPYPQETIDYINSIFRAVDAIGQRASVSSSSRTLNNRNASDPHEMAQAFKSTQDNSQRRLAWQTNLGLS